LAILHLQAPNVTVNTPQIGGYRLEFGIE
jgi:hypothetical protein